MIISISGTPGTGKTEVAKKVAEKLDFEYVSLNEIAEEKDLYVGYDEERKCRIVDTDAISEELRKRKDKNLVIESHYAHDIYSDIRIILTCQLKELRKRMEKKGWPEKKIEENMDSEIMEVIRSDTIESGNEFHEIDNSEDIEDTVREIVEIVKQQ